MEINLSDGLIKAGCCCPYSLECSNTSCVAMYPKILKSDYSCLLAIWYDKRFLCGIGSVVEIDRMGNETLNKIKDI